MGRSPCCDKQGLKKGPWTLEEDHKLMSYIQQYGHGSWRALPPKAGLQRCGKSCRLRWTNYLRPDIKRGEFSLQEQQTIIQLHALVGNRWSTIASHLPKRTDNQIKNYWNTHLKKKLTKMGINPATHKPKSHALSSPQYKDIANLSHMAQWETARLEAEARIVREARPNPTLHSPLANKSESATCQLPARPPCLDILKAWQATNRGKTDILQLDGFFMGIQQLESPNGVDPRAHVGSNCMDTVKYSRAVEPCKVGAEQLEGMMANSPMKENGANTDVMPDCILDSPRFPSFLEGLSADTVVFMEDNCKIDYWSNILNVVTSPFDSSVF